MFKLCFSGYTFIEIIWLYYFSNLEKKKNYLFEAVPAVGPEGLEPPAYGL